MKEGEWGGGGGGKPKIKIKKGGGGPKKKPQAHLLAPCFPSLCIGRLTLEHRRLVRDKGLPNRVMDPLHKPAPAQQLCRGRRHLHRRLLYNRQL